MQSLNCSYSLDIDKAYIITIPNNKISLELAERCASSCEFNQMPYQFYPAVDGTSGNIILPPHLEDKDYMKWVKVYDHELSPSEIACVLSHYSLWCHCITIDKPIVILEHDAIVVNKFTTHAVYNSIIYLGSIEQAKQGWPVRMTPPHATLNKNYHFICRAHAYSIDPAVAKKLVSHLITYGIHESLDVMLRADIFPITQIGLYAYDLPHETTTITNRKQNPDGTER